MAKKKLTRRQELFVGLYLSKPAATLGEVYRQAGYQAKSREVARVNGGKLLRLDHVSAAIEAGRAKIREKFEVAAEDIGRELVKLGFSNMLDYLDLEHGDPHLDLSGLTRDKAAAIAEVTIDQYVDGKGDDAVTVKRIKVSGGGSSPRPSWMRRANSTSKGRCAPARRPSASGGNSTPTWRSRASTVYSAGRRAREAVQSRDDHRVHRTRVHQGEHADHARPMKGLG